MRGTRTTNAYHENEVCAGEAYQMSEMFRGKAVIPGLAEIFRQIYLVPCEENEENYKRVVGSGIQPEDKSLGHFIMDERDVCEKIATPAGDVTAVTLHQRQDFETLCRCITHDYSGKPLPATMGAIHIRKIVS